MLLVCYSYVLLCYSCVTGMYSYVTRMYSYVTRMYSYVTHMYSYVLMCYSYVTRMYSYVLVCYSYVTRMYSCGVLVTIFWFGKFWLFASKADVMHFNAWEKIITFVFLITSRLIFSSTFLSHIRNGISRVVRQTMQLCLNSKVSTQQSQWIFYFYQIVRRCKSLKVLLYLAANSARGVNYSENLRTLHQESQNLNLISECWNPKTPTKSLNISENTRIRPIKTSTSLQNREIPSRFEKYLTEISYLNPYIHSSKSPCSYNTSFKNFSSRGSGEKGQQTRVKFCIFIRWKFI
jgi:hypothetical protein